MSVFADKAQQGFAKLRGPDIVESPSDIQSHIMPESFEPVKDCLDKWKQVHLFLCDFVELLIVNNRSEFVIFLFKEKRGSPRGMSTVDAFGCQVFINPFPKFCTVGFWHQVELGTIRLSSFLKLNVKVHTRSVQRENIEVLLPEYLQKHSCPIGGG